jgi:hypothetical protein
MSIDTFANLKTAIADHLDRSDLADHIPDFITLAEEMHKRPADKGGVRIKEMISRSSITVDSRQEDFPEGYLEPITFRLLTTPVTELKFVDYHEMNRLRDETSGKPEYYTIGGEFEFDHAPDSSYSGEIVYYKSETALSDSNASNNILTQAPGAYLYGALVASAPFLMDDPRIVVWQTLYAASAQGANGITKKARRGKHLVSRVAGSTP